jgi:transcriptional regulator with XRE-family HTH domain
MNNSLDLNKELLILYINSGLNQIEFAKKTKQSSSSINHWLNNHQTISYNKFFDICNNLNLKITIKIE